MNEITFIILIFITGIALGMLFFGGLWFTVKKMTASKIPAVWISASFLIRISITLIGFYYITLGNWQRLLVCLLGFVAARYLVIYITKPIKEIHPQTKKEIGYEA
jgi:F1F0 ATPase subunit 2